MRPVNESRTASHAPVGPPAVRPRPLLRQHRLRHLFPPPRDRPFRRLLHGRTGRSDDYSSGRTGRSDNGYTGDNGGANNNHSANNRFDNDDNHSARPEFIVDAADPDVDGDDPDRNPDLLRGSTRVIVSDYSDTGPTIGYMELKGFDDKRNPIVTIVGAIVALIVALWILKRIIGTLFLLAKIAIVIVMVLAIIGAFIRWSNKRDRNNK